MRKVVVAALALVLGAAVTTVDASTTTLTASPSHSTVGQKVTFTAKYTPPCTGTVVLSYFTIDGKRYNTVPSRAGQNRTDVYSTTKLAAGKHTVTYQWQVTASCKGNATLSYTVNAKASPTPTPPPSPSPSPLPSPSPTPVELVSTTSDQTPLAGYIGGGLILFAVVAGLVLAVSSRR